MNLSLSASLSFAGVDAQLFESLAEIARIEGMGIAALLSLIDQRRLAAIAAGHPSVTLASAVRVFVVAYLRQSCGPGPAEASLLAERCWGGGFQGGHA